MGEAGEEEDGGEEGALEGRRGRGELWLCYLM